MIQNLGRQPSAPGSPQRCSLPLSAKGTLAALSWWPMFTPLPIMIAALGLEPADRSCGRDARRRLTAVLLHPLLGLVYAIGFALPAWWLAYLALLARLAATRRP